MVHLPKDMTPRQPREYGDGAANDPEQNWDKE